MYNGIGLLTPRGSGTSGYVQTNKFNLHRAPPTFASQQPPGDMKPPGQRQPNKAILDHNRKREVEVALMKLADEMEAQGHSQEDIEAAINQERNKLDQEIQKEAGPAAGPSLPGADGKKPSDETHQVAARKLEQMSNLAAALGLKDVTEGEAFDPELQEAKKQQRIAEREAKNAEWEKAKLDREKKAKEAAKQQEKEREAREKEREAREKEREARERMRAEGGPPPPGHEGGRGWRGEGDPRWRDEHGSYGGYPPSRYGGRYDHGDPYYGHEEGYYEGYGARPRRGHDYPGAEAIPRGRPPPGWQPQEGRPRGERGRGPAPDDHWRPDVPEEDDHWRPDEPAAADVVAAPVKKGKEGKEAVPPPAKSGKDAPKGKQTKKRKQAVSSSSSSSSDSDSSSGSDSSSSSSDSSSSESEPDSPPAKKKAKKLAADAAAMPPPPPAVSVRAPAAARDVEPLKRQRSMPDRPVDDAPPPRKAARPAPEDDTRGRWVAVDPEPPAAPLGQERAVNGSGRRSYDEPAEEVRPSRERRAERAEEGVKPRPPPPGRELPAEEERPPPPERQATGLEREVARPKGGERDDVPPPRREREEGGWQDDRRRGEREGGYGRGGRDEGYEGRREREEGYGRGGREGGYDRGEYGGRGYYEGYPPRGGRADGYARGPERYERGAEREQRGEEYARGRDRERPKGGRDEDPAREVPPPRRDASRGRDAAAREMPPPADREDKGRAAAPEVERDGRADRGARAPEPAPEPARRSDRVEAEPDRLARGGSGRTGSDRRGDGAPRLAEKATNGRPGAGGDRQPAPEGPRGAARKRAPSPSTSGSSSGSGSSSSSGSGSSSSSGTSSGSSSA